MNFNLQITVDWTLVPPETMRFRSDMMTSSNGNTQSFDVFFDRRQYKQLSKQSRRRWFDTSSPHYDVTVMWSEFARTSGHDRQVDPTIPCA